MNHKTHTFTIEENGRLFQCFSETKGSGHFKQIVHVEGFGSQTDEATYGKSKHSASAMKLAAKSIALKIIKNLPA